MRGTRLGLGAAASAAAVTLLVGGCGSSGEGGDGGADGGKGEEGGSSSSTGSGGDTGGDDTGKGENRPDDGGPGGGGADAGGTGGDGASGGSGGSGGGSGEKADLSPYLGPWATGMKSAGGKPMILIFNKDGSVSLAAEDVACQGRLKAAEKPAKIDMECRDKGDEFTSGTITGLNDESLTVKWGSGKTMEFLKGAAPAGPSGE